MNDSENRKHQTFTRSRDFGTAHAADFAPTSLATQLFATLAAIVSQLDGHAARQSSSRGAAFEGTSTRGQAREELRADLKAINLTARAMAAEVLGIDDKFRLPPVGNDQLLLNAARAFSPTPRRSRLNSSHTKCPLTFLKIFVTTSRPLN